MGDSRIIASMKNMITLLQEQVSITKIQLSDFERQKTGLKVELDTAVARIKGLEGQLAAMEKINDDHNDEAVQANITGPRARMLWSLSENHKQAKGELAMLVKSKDEMTVKDNAITLEFNRLQKFLERVMLNLEKFEKMEFDNDPPIDVPWFDINNAYDQFRKDKKPGMEVFTASTMALIKEMEEEMAPFVELRLAYTTHIERLRRISGATKKDWQQFLTECDAASPTF